MLLCELTMFPTDKGVSVSPYAACFKDLEQDCERISVAAKMDYRKGNASRLHSKVERVEAILGRTLSKG
jgi:uncharacterized protein YqgV (UPF0045/DUF77 family)